MRCQCQKHLQWLNRDLSVTVVHVHKKFPEGPKKEKVIAKVPSIFPGVAFSEEAPNSGKIHKALNWKNVNEGTIPSPLKQTPNVEE